MRKDMSKVIVERPRTGDGWRRKGRTAALEDDDGGKLRQRAAPKKVHGSKHLNENLAPLRRYLESKVGKPWDKVHSEIAEHIRPSSTVQQHVLDHVHDYVATQTRMLDGEVVMTHRGGSRLTPVKDSWALFYVHPKTGLLKLNRHYRQPPPARRTKEDVVEDRRRDLGPFRQAHLFKDGAWWDVVLERIPTRTETVRGKLQTVEKRKIPLPFEDVVAGRGLSKLAPERLYGRTGVYAVSARRLTKAERKTLDLP